MWIEIYVKIHFWFIRWDFYNEEPNASPSREACNVTAGPRLASELCPDGAKFRFSYIVETRTSLNYITQW